MSGTVKRVSVRIGLEGADQVRAQLTSVGEAGERGMGGIARATDTSSASFGNFRNVAGQAGFQLQDFVVQVQSGTSALTALSQQGSQFLGAFGPTGAIAGAVLTVGTLVAAFLTAGDTAEQQLKRTEANFRGLQQVGEDVTRVIREINELFLTASERSAAAANAQRQQLTADARRLLDVTLQRNEGNVIDLSGARRDLDQRQRTFDRIQEANRRAGRDINPGSTSAAQAALGQAEARVAELERDISRQSERIGELQEALRRAENAGTAGPEQFGPPAPDRPRASGGAGRASRAPSADDLLARFRQAQGQVDPQARLLEQYRQQSEAFRAALDAGVVSEEEFSRAVEQSSVRLAEQMDALENSTNRVQQRAEDVDGIGRQLGLTFTSAFEDAILKGKSFRDVLKGIEQDIARLIVRKAITEPAASAIGGINFGNMFSSVGNWITDQYNTWNTGAVSIYSSASAVGPFLPAANGHAFFGGNVIPFARGGVVTRPTMFPMANGAGLMGEAGPEGVLPLKRNSRGQLGVIAEGGGGNSITQNINIDARGADAGVDQKIRAAVAVAVRQSNAELMAAINRGGSVAKAVGRR